MTELVINVLDVRLAQRKIFVQHVKLTNTYMQDNVIQFVQTHYILMKIIQMELYKNLYAVSVHLSAQLV